MSLPWIVAVLILAVGSVSVMVVARTIQREVEALRASTVALRDTRAGAQRLALEAAEAQRRRRQVAESLGRIPRR
jgi:hypothetical protein